MKQKKTLGYDFLHIDRPETRISKFWKKKRKKGTHEAHFWRKKFSNLHNMNLFWGNFLKSFWKWKIFIFWFLVKYFFFFSSTQHKKILVGYANGNTKILSRIKKYLFHSIKFPKRKWTVFDLVSQPINKNKNIIFIF